MNYYDSFDLLAGGFIDCLAIAEFCLSFQEGFQFIELSSNYYCFLGEINFIDTWFLGLLKTSWMVSLG